MSDPIPKPSRLPVLKRRRLQSWLAIATTLGCLCVGTSPVVADGIEDDRARKDAVHAEAVRAAEQLQVLGAQESELRVRLDALDQAVAAQSAKVEAAQQAVTGAQIQAADRAREVAETGRRLEAARANSVDSVVSAYVGSTSGRGGTGDAELWFRSGTLGEVVRKQQLLEAVNGRLTTQIDQLRSLGQDQDRARRAANVAVAEADRLQRDVVNAQTEFERELALQSALEQQLQASISGWRGKAAALAASEAEIDEIIRRKTGEIAAREAADSAKTASFPPTSRPPTTSGGGPAVAGGSSSSAGFLWPADGPLTSGFGYRRHPILGTLRLHAGIDIGAAQGSQVWAPKPGEVIFAGWNGGYGNCIMIEHAGGVVTLFGHLSEIDVSEGQRVGQGSLIGLVGTTGASTGPHLHFEIRIGGEPTDPLEYLP